jgi:hypothetical protein
MACVVVERGANDGDAYLDTSSFCGITQAKVVN